MAGIVIRFDLRSPAWAPTRHPELYRACLEMCRWADETGLDLVILSEHHGLEDGYLPAPVTLAAAIAGNTRRIPVNIAAVLLPLHDPVRLAEQVAVVDLVSGGRFSMTVALGYRREEFEMAGVDTRTRGRLIEEYVDVLRKAWTGEPFTWRGRTVRVTPRPLSQPHPPVFMGGQSVISARRAARLRMGYFPAVADPALERAYWEECERVGFEHGFYYSPRGPGFVLVTEDPERAWAEISRFAWYDADTYRSWQPAGQRSEVTSSAEDVDRLRQEGIYAVVTPDECVKLAEELGGAGSIVLHPLLCGMPVDLGWQSLELFASKVYPRLRPGGGA